MVCNLLFSDGSQITWDTKKIALLFAEVCSVLADEGPHLEQELYSVMDDICKLVDAIPIHELKSLSCAKELLQQRDLRYVSINTISYCHVLYETISRL